MSEQIFNTRIIHKHDIEENWNKAVNFIPKQGELIIYDIDENYEYPRIKIGDGVQTINALPFSAKNGKDGEKGQDGYTPQKTIDYWTEEDIAQIKSYVDEAILGGAW